MTASLLDAFPRKWRTAGGAYVSFPGIQTHRLLLSA